MRNGLFFCALLGTALLGCGDKAPAKTEAPAKEAKTPAKTEAPAKTEVKAPAKEAKAPAKEAKTLSDFDKYRRKSMSVEAKMNLRQMVDSATTYFELERATKEGGVLPKVLPSTAPLTPAATACKDGKPALHKSTEETWNHAGWKAFGFKLRDREFRYQYEWISDGKSFTARAVGDLDCNGVLSIIEETGKINAEGMVERDKGGPRMTRPLE